MKQLETKEIITTFEEFLNEHGTYYDFKEWIESRGYDIKEFGMTEE